MASPRRRNIPTLTSSPEMTSLRASTSAKPLGKGMLRHSRTDPPGLAVRCHAVQCKGGRGLSAEEGER
eukprot:396346-Prorocentrum_minimum.AAC.1